MYIYEPGQDRNVAALSTLSMCGGFYQHMEKLDYMNIAIDLANKASQIDEVPVGCVIVDEQGNILAKTFNLREKDNLVTSHAELLAIQKASKKLKDWQLVNCSLYVTLEPCLMCAAAISQARIKNVYYGASDPKGGAYGGFTNILEIKNQNHYPHVEGGILKEECSKVIKDFFKNKRK